MAKNITRRNFLKTTGVTGIGYMALAGATPKLSASPNERFRFAAFGVGGKGGVDLGNAAKLGDIVALCDVDKNRLNHAKNRYSEARTYTDFRKLFDKEEKNIDVVTVGTADHTHTAIALTAMRKKIHVYVQKPLARTIYECRLLSRVARETGVCSQMGTGDSGTDILRRETAEIEAGVYGDIRELHLWSDRPIWPQGPGTIRSMDAYDKKIKREKPDEAEKLIDEMKSRMKREANNVEWDLWLGPAPYREFFPGEQASIYHPFGWRGWWDFGTGALGDMACHMFNKYMKALKPGSPTSILARTSGHDFDAFPRSSEIMFEFPDTVERKGFKLFWYDGGRHPDPKFLKEQGFDYPDVMHKSGEVLIGTDGFKGYKRNEKKSGVNVPEPRLAPLALNSGGEPIPNLNGDTRNILELLLAIRDNKPEMCFSGIPNQAGPLTEAILAGNLAVWAASKPEEWGEKIIWDGEKMEIVNLADLKTPGLIDRIKPVYRKGYRLD